MHLVNSLLLSWTGVASAISGNSLNPQEEDKQEEKCFSLSHCFAAKEQGLKGFFKKKMITKCDNVKHRENNLKYKGYSDIIMEISNLLGV